jgi:catechol 2,3-dioxygenase-like lactoylglutathione lyase family enzyme
MAGDTTDHPRLLHTVIDTTDARGLAEFYRQLLGLHYRSGHAPPDDGSEDDAGWLVLLDEDDRRVVAIQQVDRLERTTWPSHDVPMQLHLDFWVPDLHALQRHRRRAEELGADLLLDCSDDENAPLCVLADPSGHPFCLLI